MVSATDWNDVDTYRSGSTLSVDLSSDLELRRFSGTGKYGYFVASQERSSFRDILMEGGAVKDMLFYVDPDSGESEVWQYDSDRGQWKRMSGTGIQDVLGYPLEITNPDTGETYLLGRHQYRKGPLDRNSRNSKGRRRRRSPG